MKRYAIFILAVLCSWFASAQDYPMLHFTIEDGLPSNTVYEIYRDSKGFLWIATDKGVARYNGYKFETFTTADGLPTNEIYFSQEDKFGRIWFGTANGELCFYKSGTIYNAANAAFLKVPFKKSYTKYIVPEKDSSLSILFFEQQQVINIKGDRSIIVDTRIDPERQSIVTINNIEKLSSNLFRLYVTRTFLKLEQHDTYVISKDTVYQYNYSVSCDTSGHHTDSVSGSYIKVIPCQNERYCYDSNYLYRGGTRILLGNKYAKYRNSISSFQNYNLNEIFRFYVSNGNQFTATNDGLYINDSIHILRKLGVSSVTEDIGHDYWISTLKDGVFKLSKDFHKQRAHIGAYVPPVYYTTIINGLLFFTTASNNLFVSRKDSIEKVFDFEHFNKSANYMISDRPGYFLNEHFRYYNFYGRENIVVDNIFAKPQKVITYKNYNLASTVDEAYTRNNELFVKSRKVRLFSFSYDGIKQETEIANHFHHYKHLYDTRRVYCIGQDPDSTIWYATFDSTYVIRDQQAIAQTQFGKKVFKDFSFLDGRMIGLTDKNQLLVCRNYGSANIVMDSIDVGKSVLEKLFRLDSTHLLISTGEKYRILDVATERLSVLDNAFIPLRAEAIVSDGTTCHFFKGADLLDFPVAYLLQKDMAPAVYFRKIKAGSLVSYPDTLISVPLEQSANIEISFSSISFSSPDILYQYSISKDGLQYWHETRNEEVNLLQPGYGTYTVQVRAKTQSSDFSQPVTFILVIERPFWAKWWFITLCIIAAVLLVLMVVRWRIGLAVKRNRKEHDTEVRFMRSEYKALNALMNPHFIFNTLNNVQSLINSDDKRAANEYLRVFADIVRQNMHNVSREVIPLQKEIDLVSNYLVLEKLRFEDKLDYAINISNEVDASVINVPPLLIQPLVENSIKHGILPLERQGRVELNIFCAADELVIEVKDNGVGISAVKQNEGKVLHESFGMDNIRKRVEQLSIIQGRKLSFDIKDVVDSIGVHVFTVATIRMHLT
jgi:two-component sensor histidine kinase